jgi:transposase, IS6 family
LSLGDVEELMAERGIVVDHTTVVALVPEVRPSDLSAAPRKSEIQNDNGGIWTRPTAELPARGCICFVPSTSRGDTIDFYLSQTRDRHAAKIFLQKALSNPDNRDPWTLNMDGSRIYPAAIRELQAEGQLNPCCRHRAQTIRE